MGIGRDEAASSRIFGRLASVAIGKPSNSVTKPHGRSPRGAAPAGSAWGTRGRWCMLSGRVGDEPVTIAILDHPANPGFPTYWHARGYGLFAANPLGRKIFTNGLEEAMNLSLAPNQSVTFRYGVLIFSEIASADSVEAAYQSFVAAYH